MEDITKREFTNILVIRTDRIGDVILSTPVLTALRNRFPEARITMMVRPYTREIVEGHPDVDEIILCNFSNLKTFVSQLIELRSKKFDAAILLHPKFRLALLLLLAQIPIRLGTGYRWYSLLFNKKVFEHRKTAEIHELDYNLHMLQKIDVPLPDEVIFKFYIPPKVDEEVAALMQELQIPNDNKIVIIHPGSGGSALDWPFDKFAQLCDKLSIFENITVILTGGSGEQQLVDQIIEKTIAKPIKIVGSLTLKQLAALIKRSHLFISNSTGPLHLAVAIGTEVIGFYCPIIPCLPTRWGPYNKIDDSVLMPQVLFRCKKCVFAKCQYSNCMDMISVEQAVELAKKKLSLSTTFHNSL